MAAVQAFIVEHPYVVGSVALIGVVIVLMRRMIPKSGPNPFRKDVSRASRPVVTDKPARNKVLKQGFSSKVVPQDLDAIVIGSGIGGLTAAAVLSKIGKKVLVLEQHDQAGGCCHIFEEMGYEFDPGIHYIGDMSSTRMVGCLFSQLTEGQVEWSPLEQELDILALGEPGKQKFYPFVGGSRETWKQGLLKNFPGEEAALDKYIAKLKGAGANSAFLFILKLVPKPLVKLVISTGLINLFTSYFKYASLSLQEVLDEVTDNKDLQAALAFNLGDYATRPSESSFLMHALLTNHYTFGAVYPRGGASEIPFHIIPVIEKSGGRVLVRAKVSHIITDDNGRAIGVHVEKGDDVNIFAPLIISDAGVMNTLQTLLPKQVAVKSSIYKYLGAELQSGCAMVQLFVGLKGTPEELGVKAQNIWAYTHNDIDKLFETLSTQSASEALSSTVCGMFISFPTAKDPTREERFPGKCSCTVVAFSKWEWFCDWADTSQNKRGAEYENLKKQFGEQIWSQVLELYPQLKDKVEYFSVGSPITAKNYLASPRGESYGLDHCRARFASPNLVVDLRPDIGIPGLYLTGQDIATAGLAGGMLGGLACVSQILNRNLFGDVQKLAKSIAKKQ